MESGLSTGDFSPENLCVTTLIKDASNAHRKMSTQEKKKVERPLNAPPFFELFREVTHFARAVASVEKVLRLVDCIRNSQTKVEEHKTSWNKEQNWQISVDSFS